MFKKETYSQNISDEKYEYINEYKLNPELWW